MQIYISHSDDDKELARALASELEQAGFIVWDEAREILPGDNWAKKVGEALESSDILIALITRPGLAADVIARDVQYALTQGKHYHGRVVPVFVRIPTYAAGKEIPWILLKLNPIELKSETDGFGEVVKRIKALNVPLTHAAH
jgi:hypothetical protein